MVIIKAFFISITSVVVYQFWVYKIRTILGLKLTKFKENLDNFSVTKIELTFVKMIG